MKLTVNLDEELGAAVATAVKSGAYKSAQAVMREALWEWLMARATNARTHGEVQVLLEEAFREMETTPPLPWTPELMEDVKRRGRERLLADHEAAE